MPISEQHVDFLLNEVTTLRKAYNLVGQQPGQGFNLFRILGMESNEVRTHSTLLAEFLNPKGNHGMGPVFLNLLLQQLGASDFNAAEATVIVEHHVGKVTDQDGGRIDLVIASKGKRILIENKIFAGDQPNQLLRYHRFDPSAALYYLTLFGSNPSDLSTGSGQITEDKYTCLSYENDILRWLEACQKEATSIPNVREGIAQYIDLIKHLTNQNFDSRMKTDLVTKILSSPDHLQSFIELQSFALPVHSKLIEKWVIDLECLSKELGLQFDQNLAAGKKWGGFSFYGDDSLEHLGIRIRFEFSLYPQGLFLGFAYPPDPAQNGQQPIISPQDLTSLKNAFRREFHDGASSFWWPIYAKWNDYAPGNLCRDILTGEINAQIAERVNKMLNIARQIHSEQPT